MRGLCNKTEYVPVAQLDRVTDSDSVGRRFESFQARHTKGSMQRMEFFVCIHEGKQRLPVRRSSRFQHENGLQSSSSADFSGTAGSGRKIKKRRVSFQARHQKSPLPYGFGDFCFENSVGFLSGFGDGLFYFCFWSMRRFWKFMRTDFRLTKN